MSCDTASPSPHVSSSPGRTPADVCFSPELKVQLPSLPPPRTASTHQPAQKKRTSYGGGSVRSKVFQHVTQPEKFYQMVVELQVGVARGVVNMEMQ